MRGQARHAVHRRGAAQVGLPLLSKSYTKESIKVRPRLAAAGIAQTWEPLLHDCWGLDLVLGSRHMLSGKQTLSNCPDQVD